MVQNHELDDPRLKGHWNKLENLKIENWGSYKIEFFFYLFENCFLYCMNNWLNYYLFEDFCWGSFITDVTFLLDFFKFSSYLKCGNTSCFWFFLNIFFSSNGIYGWTPKSFQYSTENRCDFSFDSFLH
jgi:hypothetical protein